MKMKYIKVATVAIVFVALLAACGRGGIFGERLRGEGPLVPHVLDLGVFSTIDISGFFIIDFTRSDDHAITLYMQENLFYYHEVIVRNGNLTITDNIRGGVEFTYTPRLHISAPYLTDITLSGNVIAPDWDEISTYGLTITTSGFASVDIPLNVNRLTVNSTGSSILIFSGTASSVDAYITGFADMRAANLLVSDASIDGSGSAQVEIYVTDSLDVNLSGFANVRYGGNPSITSRFSGSARLERLDD